MAAEFVARAVESRTTWEGDGSPIPDPILGWVPRPGRATTTTSEFSATADVNALGMNDRPVDASDRELAIRVLAVGDSHTYAIGVSQRDAWPLVVDRLLFDHTDGTPRTGRVFNGGVPAYSLGQYLLRFRTLEPIVRPQLALIGVSTATDLFDLLPPRLGGFVYGGNAARVYFDLDAADRLVERRSTAETAAAAAPSRSTGLRVREWLRRFALYRTFQGSLLAMRVATATRLPGGDPIWDGPEVVLHRELSEREQFQWRLASAILARFVDEAHAANTSVALVVIPYLPEVYDDVWRSTFGRSTAYDRFIGARRLADIAAAVGAAFIDTTPALVAETRRSGRWLHYRKDKHPTAEGQRIIANEVASFITAHPELLAGFAQPR